MDFAVDEPAAIRSKSLSLIEKLNDNLRRIDQWQFATQSSETARGLLLDVFDKLSDPQYLQPIDPAVLYNRLFSLQELVEMLERSATHRISWPLVRYCDEIWTQLFGDTGPKIFYSLMSEHNYSILDFSQRAGYFLRGLLPKGKIDSILGRQSIYCLQLASSEDENSPLYANIGHEFGHAVFDQKSSDIIKALDLHLAAVLPTIYAELQAIEPQQAGRLFRRTAKVIVGIAEELFCDMVGTIIMGSAFMLSLFEISWGQDKATWTVRLTPDDRYTSAYPSFNFRLDCIKNHPEVTAYLGDAKRDLPRALSAGLSHLSDCLTTIPVNYALDSILVRPDVDRDSGPIRESLIKHLTEIQAALKSFLVDCDHLFSHWYKIKRPSVFLGDVVELLKRLDHNVLPNIIPDGTLLGQPATFTAILNASALFRIYLLTTGQSSSAEEIAGMTKRNSVVRRLTAKALEVTFMQTAFRSWEKKIGSPK